MTKTKWDKKDPKIIVDKYCGLPWYYTFSILRAFSITDNQGKVRKILVLKDALNKSDNISGFTGATLVRGFGSTDAGAGA